MLNCFKEREKEKVEPRRPNRFYKIKLDGESVEGGKNKLLFEMPAED